MASREDIEIEESVEMSDMALSPANTTEGSYDYCLEWMDYNGFYYFTVIVSANHENYIEIVNQVLLVDQDSKNTNIIMN